MDTVSPEDLTVDVSIYDGWIYMADFDAMSL